MKTIFVFDAKGGLGNQLFVAAAATSLSKDLNHRTFISMLNIDWAHQNFGSDIRRLNFDRSLFVSSHLLLSILVRIINRGNQKSWLRGITKRFKITFKDQLDRQANLECLIEIQKKFPKNKIIMIEGYFQDFSYADEIMLNQDEIFSSSRLSCVQNLNYCAVHVRLGDMQRYKTTFGILSERYYKNAIELMGFNSELEIQLVSDDVNSALLMLPELALNLTKPLTVKENQDPLFGFYTILGAKRVVLSNSTYSYWAAFLNKNAEFVAAPTQMSFDQKTIVRNLPSSWKLISSEWES